MKKLVFSATALSLTGVAFANDSDWLALDQDIQALSASVQGLEGTGLTVGGRVRAFYNLSDDLDGDPSTPGQEDLGGFSLNNARLYAYGTTAQNIEYRLEVDFAGQGQQLLDAYFDVPLGAEIAFRVGQFRAHVLRESLIDSGNLFFADRSIMATIFSGRGQGIAVTGDFDAFDWALTAQNGADSQGEDLFYAARAELDFLGEGTDLIEGAYGASADAEASIGVAYFNDDALSDADGVVVEASVATNSFSLQAVLLTTSDNLSLANADQNELLGGGFINVADLGLGDTTSYSIGGTLMLTDPTSRSNTGAWEVGARWQDLDNADDTTILDIGVNYYIEGHNMKYILNYTSINSDAGAAVPDADLFRVGVQTRF